MNTDKNAIDEHHLFGESANSRKLFQIRVYLYHNDESLCFPDKKMAAKERKEHEGKHFHLCVLCVLSRQFPAVAAQAALGLSVVKLLFPDSVWQRSINRWQKVLRMKRVWWNCCIEMDAAAKQFVEERSCMLKF